MEQINEHPDAREYTGEEIEVKKYFNPPWFDLFFKWEPIQIQPNNIYAEPHHAIPLHRKTEILWKSVFFLHDVPLATDQKNSDKYVVPLLFQKYPEESLHQYT